MKKTITIIVFYILVINNNWGQVITNPNDPCILHSPQPVVGEVTCDNTNPFVLILEENFANSSYSYNKLAENWEIPYQGVLNDFDFDMCKNWLVRFCF